MASIFIKCVDLFFSLQESMSAMYLYDAATLYLLLMNETVSAGGSLRHTGDLFFHMSQQKQFKGEKVTVHYYH